MQHTAFPCRFLLFVSLILGTSLHAALAQQQPALVFSTYLGGSAFEQIRDIATDAEGNVYVTGGTASPDFPTTEGAYDRSFASGGAALGNGGPMDIFVTKFSASGELLWSTLLGGPNYDRAYGIEVDREGFVYVGGRAGDEFPTTPGALQETFAGDNAQNRLYGPQDGFVTKLSPDGSAVIWSTYFGHTGMGFLRDIDIDDSGRVYVAMTGSQPGNPYVTAASFRTRHGGGGKDLVIARISADGARVEWGGYMGGSGDVEAGPAVRVHSDGSVYFVAGTNSRDLPTTPGCHDSTYNGGDRDVLVARVSADGSRLLFCTYLGGSDNEALETHNLALDREGNAYVTSGTRSKDFPTTPGAFQRVHSAQTSNIFISKISADGSTLMASTLYGGSVGDFSQGIHVNDRFEVTVGGTTSSPDFPVTFTSPHAGPDVAPDMVFVTMKADFSAPLFATRFGGGKLDDGRSLIADERGTILVAGQTESTDFPVYLPAFASYTGVGSFDDACVTVFRRADMTASATGSPPAAVEHLRVDIAPHPARGSATLRLHTDRSQEVDIIVYDMLGVPVWRWGGSMQQNSTRHLHSAALRPGVYHFIVRGAMGMQRGRFIIAP